jgi:hypothetical protein
LWWILCCHIDVDLALVSYEEKTLLESGGFRLKHYQGCSEPAIQALQNLEAFCA